MNILVTGATGHIGNVLVRELTQGNEKVKVLTLPFEDDLPLRGLNVEIVRGDICDLDSLINAFQGIDTVYHLAGMISISSGKDDILHRVNVRGTQNVIKACATNKVNRLVYTSSIHALNEPPHGTVIDESCPPDPLHVLGDYAKCKAKATMEVKKAAQEGLDAVIVCPTGVIGPYDFRISEMGQLILDFTRRKLNAYMDGAYDFADVRDVAHGMHLAGTHGRKGETYILSGEQVSVKDLMKMLQEITGVKAPSYKVPSWLARTAGVVAPLYYHFIRSKPLFTSYSVDVLASNSVVTSQKARLELGYHSRPARESIADAVQWFISNLRLQMASGRA
ncbi:MAG: SDR family oxidoreductase [Dehalococcoidia bacterium]|nr:SDR family oxidoreductase [Dehalococcoidia bacterium]